MKELTIFWKSTLLLVVFLLTQCAERDVEATDSSQDSTTNRSLATYSIPPSSENRIIESLSAFVRVSNPASGLLLISATEAQHDEIRDFIDEFTQSLQDVDEGLGQRNIFAEYWLVAASPGETTSWDSLEMVREPLQAIQQAQGTMSFQLYNYSSGIGLEAQPVELSNGLPVSIEHLLWTERDRIRGRIEIARQFPVSVDNNTQYRQGGLDTRVSLTPRNFYVLGQIGSRDDDELEALGATTLLFIIRAQVVN